MKRDTSVTVTRDIRVTSQVRVTRDVTALSRVSHATTTTPHHTIFMVAQFCGVSGQDQIQVTVTYGRRLGIGADK